MTDNVIIITGPTASGKSDIAIKIAKAFDGEVISADSQQVYRYMDIGTNKTKEFDGINHHMLDIINPDQNFSVEDFSTRAKELIRSISSKGRVPIIAGGTGFYVDSLLFEMNYGQVSKNQSLRDNLQAISDEKGNEYLYNLSLIHI